jgi:MarR family transcriptional regulator, organic hydroperoxide resistance regulator
MVDREKLAGNIQTFVPFIFKKLIKSVPNFEISKHLLELLFLIKKEDKKTMSFYSEKMMIPKSNLSVMSDKLFEDGLIEREFDPSDRRVIILKITEKGDKYLCEHIEKMKRLLMKKLDLFNDEDIKRLNELLEEIRAIFNKMD